MRTVEILVLSADLFCLLARLVPRGRGPRWLPFLPALAALLVLIHLAAEGYRWQLIPAYGLTALLVAQMAWDLRPRARPASEAVSLLRRVAGVLGVVLGVLVLALAGVLAAILPVFRLPEPTGPHAVGTNYYYWADAGRPDETTPAPDDLRMVSAQIWYPAEQPGAGQPIRYMPREAARVLARSFIGAPESLLDHLALVRTNSYLGADVARTGSPFPVILYSTSGLMSPHMTLFEELASQGYVVVCLGHPQWNPFVYGAGGEVIPFDGQNAHYQAWWEEANSNAVLEAKARVTEARATALQQSAFVRLNELMPLAVPDLRGWAADIGFVLDELEAMNRGTGLLAGVLDLEHVGVMGFSKGGAAAGQFCVTDERCTAGINLTGFMYGDIVDINLEIPFFFFDEEELWCPDCSANELFYKRAESDAFQMKIRGARHTSFGDWILLGWLIQSANADDVNIQAGRMIHIQNVFTLAFFDHYLKGLPAPLLDDPAADYPEVILRSHTGSESSSIP